MRPIRKRRSETGVALLIAIFVLLLISVVAIALIVSSNTESALAGNYRSSTGVYYAALAGVEEARGRLLSNNPYSFQNTAPNMLPPPGATFDIGYASYVLNPSPNPSLGENQGNLLTLYPDTEYANEFGVAPGTVNTTLSVWDNSANPLNALPFPGPLYKWVRINAVSEKSLNLDVDADGLADSTTPLYFDNTNRLLSNNPGAGPQALELTALAVLPNGSQKLLQYLTAPAPLNLNFPAALTLDGNNVQFSVPTSTSFWVNGADQGSAGSCNPGASVVTAVGYTNGGDSSHTNIVSAIPSGPPATLDMRTHYTNGIAATPNVGLVTVPPNLTTVAGLNALVQTITQNADVVINGNATQTNMPSAMSSTNPMTIVVNGDLTFSGWHSTGYGLLLVTGEFTYDPDASWDGIVLMIGDGKIYSHQSGTGQILGAVFLANTAGGSPFFDFTSSSGSNGIYYSSCWIQAAQPTSGYKILSFHEISQ